MREVTRLETLDVSLYKKVTFSPEPKAEDALWKDVINWAAYKLNTPRGRAIVFADVHLGYDFQRIDTSSLQVTGTKVEVALPPLEVKVELRARGDRRSSTPTWTASRRRTSWSGPAPPSSTRCAMISA